MDANVTINCVHPGVVRTRLTRDCEGFITGDYAQTYCLYIYKYGFCIRIYLGGEPSGRPHFSRLVGRRSDS